MASPTPSIESLPRANSIGSFGDQHDYISLSPLADSPLSHSGSSPPISDSVDKDSDHSDQHCQQCRELVLEPKLLSCFHTFCNTCLEKNKLVCPRCSSESIEGILNSLLFNSDTSDFSTAVYCTGCKHKKLDAVARCVDCANFLCSNCVMAHQFMHCFEGHRVVNLPEVKEESKNGLIPNGNISNSEKGMICPRHKSELLKYYCRTCSVPICKECNMDHPVGLHEYEHISEAAPKQIEAIQHAISEAKNKATDVRNILNNVERVSNRLQVQYQKAQNEINDTFLFYRSMLEERKQELLKELESVFSAKQISLEWPRRKAKKRSNKYIKLVSSSKD